LFLLVDGECGKEKNILTAVSVKHKEIVEDTVRYSSSCFASPSFTPKILEPLFNLVESPMSSVKHGEAYIPIENTPLNLNSGVIGEEAGRRSLHGAHQMMHAIFPTSINRAAVDAQAGQTAQPLAKASVVADAPPAMAVGPLGKEGPIGPVCNSPIRTNIQASMHGRGGPRGTSINLPQVSAGSFLKYSSPSIAQNCNRKILHNLIWYQRV
jgi:hypothetical protein